MSGLKDLVVGAPAPAPTTATKAHVAGGTSAGAILLLGLLGHRLGLPTPPVEDLADAFIVVAEAAIGGLFTWFAAWRASNKAKQPKGQTYDDPDYSAGR